MELLVGDGAYGTALGADSIDGPVDQLCIDHPERVVELHEAYVAAGARLVQSNTFLTYTVPAHVRARMYEAGVACARRGIVGATTPARVAVTVGPVGGSEEEVAAEIGLALAAAPDVLLVETLTDQDAARCVLDAIATLDSPPLAIVSLSIAPSRGADSWAWLADLEPARGVRIGLNCCEGPEGLRPALELLAARWPELHLAPSAGLPGATLAPTEWARAVRDLAAGLPVRSVGGCCGTTVAHVAALTAEATTPA